ncbi:polyphenol oxidase family protein [Cellulosimicrobium marinum]|uniref:polyphenol oxidase family protein n=1 Tax=Cellulosimicrobium marinum TaxID=1638992 RepID=UPI001E348FFD|nr:polyphenol oxidase family protein [Cellulosimicrobium marinum]MCB7137789.1 polyphenol oxidase family protein [Cellulosimicrobium marinum]
MTARPAPAEGAVLPVLEADLGPGVRAGFTTRAGGVSPVPWDSLDLGLGVGDEPERVRRNRARVAQWLGRRVAFATQVHGTRVHVVDAAWPAGSADVPDSVGEADALVTRGGAGLGVLVADCVPVLLADPVARVVAVAHAGRRGVADGVVAHVLDALVSVGADLGQVRAAVGPSACGRCYEVPAPMRDALAASRPAAWSTTRWGTAALDLPAAVEADLRAGGVPVVERSGACTLEDARFFSHRRAVREGATTGRFAGVVALDAA